MKKFIYALIAAYLGGAVATIMAFYVVINATRKKFPELDRFDTVFELAAQWWTFVLIAIQSSDGTSKLMAIVIIAISLTAFFITLKLTRKRLN